MSDSEQISPARIAKEVERLDQEVRVIQHVLDEQQPGARDEVVRLLRHLASRANRIAAMVEQQNEDEAR